jgi:DNA-binding SARP family transcriptional activator
MRCFVHLGQPHLALRQYRACAAALDRELGVDPDPATVALAQRIRGHQPV